MASTAQSAGTANAPRPGAPPRWHRVYYLLAAFDVFTVSVSLYLNHRIMSIYLRSVEVNRAWAEILQDSSRLGQLAAAINAPGNDVFASRQADAEARRMTRARRMFGRELAALRDRLRARAGPEQAALLEEDYRALRGATAAMAGEAERIFPAFRRGDVAEAGKRMADMDRKYAAVHASLARLRQHVGAIQQDQFARQTAAAGALQSFEYVIAGLIAVMVAAATWYGAQMARQVQRATREREEHLAALRLAHDVLESRVRERTAELERANAALRHSEARAREWAEVRTRLLAQVITAQEDERRRIARDLHDEVGQSLTSLLLGLRSIPKPDMPGQAGAEELRRIAVTVLAEVRRLARGLRPAVLDDLGLGAALERYAADFTQATGINVRREVSDDLGRLPGAVETALYRIVQEALTNAAKHAAARGVRVVVARRPAAVEAVVEDDGRGFDTVAVARRPAGDNLGLAGMRERAALVGGEVTFESRPGRGTRVTIRIPLSGETHGQDPGADRG